MPSSDEIAARRADVENWYRSERFKCQLFEQRFAEHLRDVLKRESVKGIQFESRTKSAKSVVDKAVKIDATGQFKYADPRSEITDFVGVRVIVPSATDLDAVAALVEQRYAVAEQQQRGLGDDDTGVPGYRGLHFLVRLRDEDRAATAFSEFGDMIVEVQVRTILQHAWASLQHDMMYKSAKSPSRAVTRRLTALAGLLELADREFVEVRAEYQGATTAPAVIPAVGRLTTSALRNYVESLFDEDDPASHVWFAELHRIVGLFGAGSMEDVSALIGEWQPRAAGVRDYVRSAHPTANTAFAFDLLLRLALGDRYLDVRSKEDETPLTDDIRVAFDAETEAVRRAVGA